MKPRVKPADILALAAALGLLLWFLAAADSRNSPKLLPAAAVTLIFSVGGWLAGGVSATGAVAGAVVAFIFYWVGGWPLFRCLFVAFLTTLLTTRAGRRRKLALGVAESAR